MAKSIIIYNNFSSNPLPDGIKVWAPITSDINAITNYLTENNIASSIQLEIVFKKVLDNPSKFNFFSRKKSELIKPKKVVLYAQSDTLSNSCHQIAKSLKNHEVLFMVPAKSTENAHVYLEEHNISFEYYSFKR